MWSVCGSWLLSNLVTYSMCKKNYESFSLVALSYSCLIGLLLSTCACVEPKMRHLNNMAIPKIAAAYWKKVADALEFEVWKIKKINKEYKNDCDELLREWLSPDFA